MSIKPHFNVLSPHNDDVALSLNLTLRTLIKKHRLSTNIINCFTVSDCSPTLRDKHCIYVISKIRKNEDVKFASYLGDTTLFNIDLPDAPKRYPRSDIFNIKFDTSADVQLLTRYLLKLKLKPGAWVLPLAIGNHIDHRICRECGLAIMRNFPTFFFEDIPYSLFIKKGHLAKVVGNLERLTGKHLIRVKLADSKLTSTWQHAVVFYRTQFDTDDIEIMQNLINKKGGEFIWITNEFLTYLSDCGISISNLATTSEMFK